MLKKIYILLTLVCLITLSVSCEQSFSDTTLVKYNLELSRDTLLFDVDGGMKSVEILTEQDEWEVVYDGASWLQSTEFRDADGHEVITITADKSNSLENRESVLTVKAGPYTKELRVIQIGKKPAIMVETENVSVDKEAAIVDVPYVANIDFTVVNSSSWITTELMENSDGKFVRLKIAKNETGNAREYGIMLNQVGGDVSAIIAVTQSATLSNYVPEDVKAVTGNKKIPVLSATASSELANYDITKSFDGKYNTYFQSDYQETGTISFTYKLNAGTDMLNYIVYYPSEEAKTQSLKSAKIYVKKVGESTFTLVTSTTFDQLATKVISFDNPIENVDEIKFEVVSTYAATGSVPSVSCAEVEFYTSAVIYDNIFTDMTYSALLPNVTMDDVLNINNVFYRNIAKHLLNDTYENGRILQCTPIQGDRLNAKVNKASLYENATGIYVEANSEVVVFCGKLTGAAPSIKVLNTTGSVEYSLKEGVNKIVVSRNGKLYVNNPTAIKIHIPSGIYEGIFDSSNINNIQNLTLRDNNVVDIVTDNYHIIAPLDYAKTFLSNITTAKTNLDKFILQAKSFYGVNSGTYMVNSKLGIYLSKQAADVNSMVNITTNELEAVKAYTTGNNATIVGVLEKIGEAYEPYVNRAWAISGVTAKLFAMDYLYANGLTSIAKLNGLYPTAFQNILVADYNYASVSDNWSKVVPLWQLNHYFKQVLGVPDYYAQLTKKVKALASVNTDYTVHLKAFTNEVANVNFKTFYEAWNMGTATVNPTTLCPGALHYYIEDNKALYVTLPALITGSYMVLGGKPTLVSYKNVTAIEVYNAGFLAYVEPYQVGTTLKVNMTNFQSNMKIVAVGANGDKINVN